jgi:hypothetical protein
MKKPTIVIDIGLVCLKKIIEKKTNNNNNNNDHGVDVSVIMVI